MFPLVACPVSSAGCERWGECPRNAWRTLMKSFIKISIFFLVRVCFLKYFCTMNVNILFFSSLCGLPVVREFD